MRIQKHMKRVPTKGGNCEQLSCSRLWLMDPVTRPKGKGGGRKAVIGIEGGEVGAAARQDRGAGPIPRVRSPATHRIKSPLGRK